MKKFLSLVFSLLTVLIANAHEYHFAFAEAEYNLESKTVQATVTVSTHDFEHTLIDLGMDIQHLESYRGNTLMEIAISDQILEHFSIQVGQEQCRFRLAGYEVLHSGMTNFYFESEPLSFSPEVHVRFDLMMDANPEQQNKLTFIYGSQKKTVPFLFNERQQVLEFKIN